MVFKVSKAGVRSGNTLRGLQSKRTKQYGRHACLIGSSNLGRRAFQSLLDESSEEDALVGDTLKRTDVLLSLNKKQRWRVPAMVNHMISSGSMDKGTIVSLLERHKLKRRANCVRYTCNGGRLPNVKPKEKTYFCLSLDKVDDEQSNREKRKLKAEELNKLKVTKEGKLGRINIIDTYTRVGKSHTLSNRFQESTREEYRLEVFYPCPQSCSLTFNPKYTDVVLDEGRNGHLEVKANVKQPKKRQKYRRNRITSNDVDKIANETMDIYNDILEDFSDNETDENYDLEHTYHRVSDHHSKINYLEMLINKAEKAQSLFKIPKCPHKKAKLESNRSDNKLHIVHIDNENENENSTTKISQNNDPPRYLLETKPLNFAKVILKSSEATKEFLDQKYGSMYSEGTCRPRRFTINITDDVSNLMSYTRTSSRDLKFTSYLVFIFDGVYDNGLEVYRMILNSYSYNLQNLAECIPFSTTSFDDIVNAVSGCLLDLNESKLHDLNLDINRTGMYAFLYDRMNLKVKTYNPSFALSDRNNVLGDTHGKISTELDDLQTNYSSNFDEDIFCDICYDTINITKMDAAYGTKLASCGHHCCDKCWALHFQNRLRDGITTITCPGYDCKTEIGLITLLSLVKVSDIALLFQRKAEEEIDVLENAKWCPNPTCRRIIKIDSKHNDLCQDVVCGCGTEICFECQGSTHWPAKCYQAEEYMEKLLPIKPPKESVEEEDVKPMIHQKSPKIKKPKVFLVEGRICPRCTKFIDRNGGCNNIECRCGFQFCWRCMKPSHNNYYSACKVDHKYLMKFTRLLRIHHCQRKFDRSSTKHKLPKVYNAKQKATLYQRALQQRHEATQKSRRVINNSLILKIVSAAHTDLDLKREIISRMAIQPLPEDDDELKRLNVKASVVQLLKSTEEIKRVLHHVAEFSFVLIQDTPHSVEKQRILRLANDISGICSFFSSILGLGGNQNAKTAFQRLISIQDWAKRALDALIAATRRLRQD